jgi:putative endonuclease
MMTNKSGTLYAGITNDIARRVYEHQLKLTPGFTSKYNISRLIWVEEFGSPTEAIAREKQIKGWTCAKKLALIRSVNPKFKELTTDGVFS